MSTHNRGNLPCYTNDEPEPALRFQSTSNPKINIQSNVPVQCQTSFLNFLTEYDSMFTCNLCLKVFKTKGTFSQHMELHTRKFSCSVCQKEFQTEVLLDRHMESHYSHTCDVCQKKFKTVGMLSRHMRTHTDTIACSVCNRRLASKLALFQHFKSKHWSGYKCHICNIQFPDRATWISHLSYDHRDGQVYVCKICRCQLYSFIAFNNHFQSHVTECVCVMCNLNYPSKQDLQIHLLEQHSQVKEFLCNLCGMSWSENRKLIEHMEQCHVLSMCEAVYTTYDNEGGGGAGDKVINNNDESCDNAAKTTNNIPGTLPISNRRQDSNQHNAPTIPKNFTPHFRTTQNQQIQPTVNNFKKQKRKLQKNPDLPDFKKARNEQQNSNENGFKSPLHEDNNTASSSKVCDYVYSDLTEAQKHFEKHHSIPSSRLCKICNRTYIAIHYLSSHFKDHIQKIGEGEYVCSERTKTVDGNEIVFNDIGDWTFEGDTGSGNEDVHIKTEVICVTDENSNNSSVNSQDLSTSVSKSSSVEEDESIPGNGVLPNGSSVQLVTEKLLKTRDADDRRSSQEKLLHCDAVYNQIDLGRHLFDKHIDYASLSCKICISKFSTFDKLMLHMNSHVVYTGNMKYACSQACLKECNIIYTNPTELAKHFKACHFQSRPPFCMICNKIFTSLQHLYDHLKYHTVSFGKRVSCSLYRGNFPCKRCLIVCSSAHSLQEHYVENRHADIRYNDYNGVGSSTKTVGSFSNMQRQKGIFWCNVCNIACESNKMLQDHMCAFHNLQGQGIRNTEFLCSVCSTACASAQALKEHIESVHYNCNLIYTSLNSIQQHLKLVHADLIATFCKICRSPFPTIDHLKQHIACHIKVEGENQFACAAKVKEPKNKKPMSSSTIAISAQNSCNRVYKSWRELEKHFTSVHCVRDTLYCHICIRCFSTFVELRDHIRSHTWCIGKNELVCPGYGNSEKSEPRFTCGLCATIFVSSSDLTRHSRLHFMKDSCDEVYSKLFQIQLHLRINHLTLATTFCNICKRKLHRKESPSHMDSHIVRLGENHFACALKSNNTHYVSNESVGSSSTISAEMNADGSLCSEVTYNVVDDDYALLVTSPQCESGALSSGNASFNNGPRVMEIEASVSRLSNDLLLPSKYNSSNSAVHSEESSSVSKHIPDASVQVDSFASKCGNTKSDTTEYDEVILLDESSQYEIEGSRDSIKLICNSGNESEERNKNHLEMKTTNPADTNKKKTTFNTSHKQVQFRKYKINDSSDSAFCYKQSCSVIKRTPDVDISTSWYGNTKSDPTEYEVIVLDESPQYQIEDSHDSIGPICNTTNKSERGNKKLLEIKTSNPADTNKKTTFKTAHKQALSTKYKINNSSHSALCSKKSCSVIKYIPDASVQVDASSSRYGHTKTNTIDDEIVSLDEYPQYEIEVDLICNTSNKSEEGNIKYFEMKTSNSHNPNKETYDEVILLDSP